MSYEDYEEEPRDHEWLRDKIGTLRRHKKPRIRRTPARIGWTRLAGPFRTEKAARSWARRARTSKKYGRKTIGIAAGKWYDRRAKSECFVVVACCEKISAAKRVSAVKARKRLLTRNAA